MSRLLLPLCLMLLTVLPAQTTSPVPAQAPMSICNRDRTLCVSPALRQSLIRNPLYFQVQVRSADPIILGWELRDDSGKVLDTDPQGDLAFLVKKLSSSERILAVRDFALTAANSAHGILILHAIRRNNRTLPGLSIPVRLDRHTTTVTFAVPGGGFSEAVINTVEADPSHPVPMQAAVDWLSTTLLYIQPSMVGGAAAESTARAYPGQGTWHVVRYRRTGDTVHLTIHGDGWAGVTYYLTGLHYLLEKTALHQPGVRRVVFGRPPDFGQ